MSSLMTPNTALFYEYLNIEPSAPLDYNNEEDVFSRAFKVGTISTSFTPPIQSSKESTFLSLGDSLNPTFLDGGSVEMDIGEYIETSPSSLGSAEERGRREGSHGSVPELVLDVERSGESHPSPIELELSRFEAAASSLQTPTSPTSSSRFHSSQLPPTTSTHIYPYPQHQVQPQLQQQDVSASTSSTKRKRRRRTVKPVSTHEEAVKRTAFLERNRQAAQKCRSRKKIHTSTLEEDMEAQEERNARLKGEVEALRREVEEMRRVLALCERECSHAKREDKPNPVGEGRVEGKDIEMVENGEEVMREDV